jgi:hypothetical protein
MHKIVDSRVVRAVEFSSAKPGTTFAALGKFFIKTTLPKLAVDMMSGEITIFENNTIVIIVDAETVIR